jgi:prolyl-tRNA editing enzyme YbaK/EbsC (Cys-tRNA(Pro) deacylase)
LKRATGKEPGAICLLLLDIPIFVDKRVFETEKINFGSGDHLYGLEISSNDLEKIIDFETIDVVQV